jgi:NTE family protein
MASAIDRASLDGADLGGATASRRIATRLPPELREDPGIASIIAEGRAHPATVLYLSYRAALDEAGPAKVFDFSRATFAERWQKGEREMQEALRTLAARNDAADVTHSAAS